MIFDPPKEICSMRLNQNFLGLLCVVMMSPSQVFGQPSNGFLYGLGAVSNSYTQYSCEGSSDRLVCKFTQMMLTPQLKEDDYETELAKQLRQAKEEAKRKGGLDVLHNELCGGEIQPHLKMLEQVLEGDVSGLPPENRDKYYAMGKAELQGYKDQMQPMVDVCRDKPSDWIERLSRSSLDKSLKTCKLMANNYEWTFKETSPGVFTSRNGPTGACGVVSVSVFTPVEGIGALYNYREQRVVTNKSASIPMLLGDMKCTDVDESSLEYTWNSSKEFRNCVYIKLGL